MKEKEGLGEEQEDKEKTEKEEDIEVQEEMEEQEKKKGQERERKGGEVSGEDCGEGERMNCTMHSLGNYIKLPR